MVKPGTVSFNESFQRAAARQRIENRMATPGPVLLSISACFQFQLNPHTVGIIAAEMVPKTEQRCWPWTRLSPWLSARGSERTIERQSTSTPDNEFLHRHAIACLSKYMLKFSLNSPTRNRGTRDGAPLEVTGKTYQILAARRTVDKALPVRDQHSVRRRAAERARFVGVHLHGGLSDFSKHAFARF